MFGKSIIIFVSLLLVGLTVPVSALSAQLSIESFLGFNGNFQLSSWTPLTVVLENRGRALNGTVEVIVTSGKEYLQNVYQIPYLIDVELPYNSKKLCSFTIQLDTFIHEILIQFRQGDTILLSKTLNLRAFYTEKPFVVVVDDKASPDFLAGLPQDLFPVNVRPRFLPETWYGYESVKMMVINTAVLKRLRDRQFQALIEWIRQGGYLITTGGINVGVLLEQRAKQLLSVKILGHREFLELKALKDFCGQALKSPDPFLVLHANIENAEILIQERDVPIILQKSLGAGKILFVAFEFQTPPFSRWSARSRFWETLWKLQPPAIDKHRVDIDRHSILGAMFSHLPASFPNVKFTFIFIAIYLLLLQWFFLQIKKPGEKRWNNVLALLLVIVVFSLGSYWLFFHLIQQKKLTYNSFLSLDFSGQHHIASGQYVVGLYALQETDYTLQFEAASYPVTPILSKNSRRNIPIPYQIHEELTGQQVTGTLEKWSHNFFLLHTNIEFPVTGQTSLDEQGLRLFLDNLSSYPILDCLVYFENKVFFVGDVSPGEKQTKEIPRTEIRLKEVFEKQQTESIIDRIESHRTTASLPADSEDLIQRALRVLYPNAQSKAFFTTMQKDLMNDVLWAVHSDYQSRPDVLCLIGWVPVGLIQAVVPESGTRGEELTLIIWEIPIGRET